eukprot:COSAG02_NODE_20035_length_851_cov_1.041223_2_plen_41_part_01
MCAGKRGIDEDWALGEVEEIAGDLRSQDTSGERHLEQDDCE